MQPPAGKLKKSCGKITNFYDKKEPSGPEVNPKSQTKIRNIAIFKMKAHIHVNETNRNCPADFSPPLHGATSYYPSRGRRHVLFFYCVFAAENVCIWPPSKALFEAIRHILARFQDSENKESHDKTAFINGLSWLFLLSSRAGQIRTISHCFSSSQGILKADGLRTILVVERNQHPVIIQENRVHKNLNQCFALFLLRYIELSEFHQPEPDEIGIEGWLS